MNVALVILDHRQDIYLDSLVAGARRFAPQADVWLYPSGRPVINPREGHPTLAVLPQARRLSYARIMPFYFDLFDWMVTSPYDAVMTAETDMAFIAPNLVTSMPRLLNGADHLATHLTHPLPPGSWRAGRTLGIRDHAVLLDLLAVRELSACFSPGQVFTAAFARAVVASPRWSALQTFVQSADRPAGPRSLQETLLATVAASLGLTSRPWPPVHDVTARARPVLTASEVTAARRGGAFWVHPVARDMTDPARQLVERLALPRPRVDVVAQEAHHGS